MFLWIQLRDTPTFTVLLRSMQHVERTVHENMAADLSIHMNCSQSFARTIELHDVALVPLAQINVLAVETEIRTGKVRIGKPAAVGKAAAWAVRPHVAI